MRPDAHTLVAAYAVDALDGAERADVRAHLDECPTCREDLRVFRETVAVMALATAEAPPARMREQVLARARRTSQLPPLTGGGSSGRTVGQVPAPSDPVDPDEPTEHVEPLAAVPTAGPARPSDEVRTEVLPRRAGSVTSGRPAGGRALFGLAASGLAVVALGAGAFGVVQSERLGDAREQQAAVQRVLAADDVVTLSGTPQLSDGVQGDDVVVLASATEDAALLLPGGLPDAPEGSTWQAWTVTGDRADSAGVFDVGTGEAVALQASLAGADAFAVSLEPDGGSETPSTDPVLVMPLA